MKRNQVSAWNGLAALAVLAAVETAWAEAGVSADWPTWRGDGSGASHSGAEMVTSLDQAKRAWQSDPVGLSGCMYPGGVPGEGWCDPVIAGGRVFVFWFRRAGPDVVDLHRLAASRGWASLIDPPDNPEAFARGGGHRTSLPSKEMCAIQRFVRADDIVTCLDDRTGKRLWERVFPARGLNHVRVYSPLCVPCVNGGRLYALGSAGRVYALDTATGKTVWESDIGERAEQLDQIAEIAARCRHRAYDSGWLNTIVAVADGVVAVGEGAGVEERRGGVGMVGLDAATGRRLWTVADCLENVGSPAVWRHSGKEYLLAAGERMVLVEPRTGKVLWAIGGPGDRITDGCAPAVSGDYVVVAKNVAKTVGMNPVSWWRGPSCYRLSLEKAERVWSRPMVDGISLIAPSIHGKHAYVCDKGGVACVELETGQEVGQPIPGFSSAYAGYAVGDGLVFRLGQAATGFPEMKVMKGALPGNPDFGEIHAPATANGRVYWRGKRSVWCYDFRKNPPPDNGPAHELLRDLTGIQDNPAQLAAVIEKEGWPVRAAAAERLRLLGGKGKPAAGIVQKLLLSAVAAKDWGDTDLLIETLLAIDPAAAKPAAPELAKLLDSADERIWRLGCHGLALMGPQAAEAVPALAKHLDPAQPEQAALAARALGKIGPVARAAAPALVRCLEPKDDDLTNETAAAFGAYARLNVAEERALLAADRIFASNDFAGAQTAYETFRKTFPASPAAAHAAARIEVCKKRQSAGDQSAKHELDFHAAKALCHVQPADAACIAATVDAVLAHPWFVRMGADAPPRRASYKAMALSLMGKDAVPVFLDRARAVIVAGERPVKKGTPASRVGYASVCDLASAAFVMDPQSASDFLPLLAKIPRRNPPVVDPTVLSMTEKDLNGTLDQRDPLGRVAGREAADKKAAEESKKQKQEQKKALDEIPEL